MRHRSSPPSPPSRCTSCSGSDTETGAGVTVPLASVVSLAFFGNWNVGQYDMVSPQGLTERSAKYEYVELGVGVAIR